jgi:hypothetical protein
MQIHRRDALLALHAHLEVGGRKSHREALAAPIDARVFFAGEATETGYPATIDGALPRRSTAP